MLSNYKNKDSLVSYNEEKDINWINYVCKYALIVITTMVVTCIVNTTYGYFCSFNVHNIFYSLAMSGSPICKTLSKTSYFLNGFVDMLFLGMV